MRRRARRAHKTRGAARSARLLSITSRFVFFAERRSRRRALLFGRKRRLPSGSPARGAGGEDRLETRLDLVLLGVDRLDADVHAVGDVLRVHALAEVEGGERPILLAEVLE